MSSDDKGYKFQRYDLGLDDEMEESAAGDWVKYDDALSALESANAEIARLKEEIEFLHQQQAGSSV